MYKNELNNNSIDFYGADGHARKQLLPPAHFRLLPDSVPFNIIPIRSGDAVSLIAPLQKETSPFIMHIVSKQRLKITDFFKIQSFSLPVKKPQPAWKVIAIEEI